MKIRYYRRPLWKSIHHEGTVEDSETIISWKLSKVLSKVRHKGVHEEKSNLFLYFQCTCCIKEALSQFLSHTHTYHTKYLKGFNETNAL